MKSVKSTIRNPVELGKEKLEEFINRKSMEWLGSVQDIIRNEDAIDTGTMLNSVFTTITEDGFIGSTSVDYMKYFEFGTEPHWVPFYGKGGEEILAPWGRRVLKLNSEEMKKMGGIVVSTPEIAAFRRSLAKL